MELIYYPDHEKRYAHIHERDRWQYPDEIRIGHSSPIKRVKPLKEIMLNETGGHDPLLLANDVPISEVCIH